MIKKCDVGGKHSMPRGLNHTKIYTEYLKEKANL